MHNKIQQQIETKIAETSREIIDIVSSAVDTGSFTYESDAIVIILPKHINDVLDSFVGSPILKKVRPVLEEMLEMPIEFRFNSHWDNGYARIIIHSDKKY